MKKVTFLAVLILLVLTKHACGFPQNWFFSVEEDGIICIDLVLPDDAGYTGKGTYEYKITCEPKQECILWGSTLTEQRVSVGENNTGIIPICFNSLGKSIGTCSEPMIITVESPLIGVYKTWEGGICVSDYRDIETVNRQKNQKVMDVLNENFDLFDAKFEEPRVYSNPGEEITYTLLLYSQANITLDITIENQDLEISPKKITVSFSKRKNNQSVEFKIKAPETQGTYTINADIHVKGCTENYCRREARGLLIVGTKTDSGFSVSLFPETINIKKLEPVSFTLTLHNYGERQTFDISLSVTPNYALKTMRRETIELDKDEIYRKNFLVTPLNRTAFYEITAFVSSGKNTKKASSYISTNEMLTDIGRMTETAGDAENRMMEEAEKWYKSVYTKSEYGDEIKEYASLREVLGKISTSSTRENETQERPPRPAQRPEEEKPQHTDWMLWSIIAFAILIVIIAFYLSSKRIKSEEEQYLFYQ